MLAVVVTVGLVQQLQCLNEYLEAFLGHGPLHVLIAEELLENLDRCHAEVAVAKRDEQVVLQAREYLKPAVQLLSLEILLQTGREDLYMRPLQVLQVVIYHILLQGLRNIEGVPLVRCPKSPILLCVSPGHVHFLLGARQRLHFQDG